jgi:hypothetical protein
VNGYCEQGRRRFRRPLNQTCKSVTGADGEGRSSQAFRRATVMDVALVKLAMDEAAAVLGVKSGVATDSGQKII